jgi:hypothetical protein
MDQLMQKLMISKAIMDRSDNIKRGDVSNQSLPQSMIQEFNVPQAKYNIPQEYLSEQNSQQSNMPIVNTKPTGSPTVDAIKNSKLPDEIKRLMMEHPIQQQQQQTVTISNDLVERASRLMKENGNSYVPDSAKPKQSNTNTGSVDYNLINKMIKEAVNESLRENGLLVESTEKSTEVFSFKVGKHVFEGKVTKIKKLS